MSVSGEDIKRLRKQKGLTQFELAKEAKIDPSVLSRIETGNIDNPELIKTLKNILEPIESIEKDSDLKIGFGHCIWASPVIVLAMQASLSGLRITSYGGEKGSGIYDPYFYTLKKIQKEGCIRTCSVTEQCINTDAEIISPPFKIKPWKEAQEEHQNIRTYTASDVKRLMNSNELDCIVVPGKVYDESAMVKCAYVMYTPQSGCKLLLIATDKGKDRYDNILKFLRDKKHKIKDDEKLELFYPPDTIAEQDWSIHLKKMGKSSFQGIQVDLGAWNDFTVKAKETLNQDGIFGLLAWEPQISWIKRELEGVCIGSREWDISYELSHARVHDPKEFLSFEIFFRKSLVQEDLKKSTKNELIRNISFFFQRIDGACKALSDEIIKSSLPGYIAKYLDIKKESCEDYISKHNFSMMFYPEWYEFAVRLGLYSDIK